MKNKIFNDIKKDLLCFFEDILSNKSYYLTILFFGLMAYGLDLFNDSINMDDMAFYVFGKEHYGLSMMRWGVYLLGPFINTMNYSPYINRFFALFFFFVASILLSFLMYCINDEKKGVLKYIILSTLFITYPLINEIWECSAMSINIYYNGVSFYFCLVFISLIYLYYVNKYSIKSLLFSGLMLSPVVAGYESVLFAYITLVLIIIYSSNLNGKYKKPFEWFVEGLRYAIPLVIALILRIAIGEIIITLYNLPNRSSLSRSYWKVSGFKETILQILNNGWYYVIRGLSYFPIGEFVVALIVFIIFVLKDFKTSKLSLLFGLGIIISLFFLSIVQGDFLYYRQAQTIQVFVAYIGYSIVDRSFKLKNRKVYVVISVFMILICLKQSVKLHEYLALNHQRSENESYVAKQIGYRIYSEFDKEKTVIFCGEYQLGKYIQEQIVVKDESLGGKLEKLIREKLNHREARLYNEYIYNNVNSYFNKQMDAWEGQTMLREYLSYYGFDLSVLDDLTREEEAKLKGYYENIAKEENMKPYEIKDMGDYILVYLGPTIDSYSKLEY